MPTITDLLVPWHLSQWTFAFILNYTTSHCFLWNILAWLWQLYQLLLQQLLLSTYIVPHKLKHTHINTSQVSQPTCYFELENLTTKKAHSYKHTLTHFWARPSGKGRRVRGWTNIARIFVSVTSLWPKNRCWKYWALCSCDGFVNGWIGFGDGRKL